MEKMDEMDKEIDARAYMYGYKVLAGSLLVWQVVELIKFINSGEMNIVPLLIMNIGIVVQDLSKKYIKKKMIEGDEEYKQPKNISNKMIVILAIFSIVLSIYTILNLISEYIL